jgi:hypothetical protein
MSCPQCIGIEESFNKKLAASELARFRRKGPRKTTRMLIEGIAAHGVRGATLLDVGGGVGAVHFGLFAMGVRSAEDIDAATSYLRAAEEEAVRRDLASHVRYRFGNFAEIEATVADADIVSLDRVVCCYDDVQGLLGAAVRHARRMLGIVRPRDTIAARIANGCLNLWQRLRGSSFRTFVHAAERIDALARDGGMARASSRHTMFWQVDVYARAPSSLIASSMP